MFTLHCGCSRNFPVLGIKNHYQCCKLSWSSFVTINSIDYPSNLFGGHTHFMYGCEAWTLYADTEKRIQAFEFKCLRKLLRISYMEHKTNEYVRSRVTFLAGPHEPLLATVKRRKLGWFGHTTCCNGLSKTILQGTLEGSRRRGRQRKSWTDNVKDWTGLTMPVLLARAQDRPGWRALSREVALM